jgi:hypothetical protein
MPVNKIKITLERVIAPDKIDAPIPPGEVYMTLLADEAAFNDDGRGCITLRLRTRQKPG